ncbi:MAG: EAL domain-containing protein [Lachnospiraceae bacterium]|nr:EAL domain-containing protein [Lachnospiraceae bacterium]
MDICSISWKYNERIFYPSASVGIVKYPLQGFELEENNRGGSIDQMETALQQKREWEKSGIYDLKVSINISGSSLMQNSFLDEVVQTLERYPVDTKGLQFEITESTYIQNSSRISRVLQNIRDLGIFIALDDFGTGYSSFNYLKTMPIDVIKLDATFVSGILNGTQDRIIFDAMNQLTHNLGMLLIAEGIETEDENILIRQEGCDFGQGYLYGRPSEPEKIFKLLQSQKITRG